MLQPDYENDKVETAFVARPFVTALKELTNDNYQIISLQENVRLIIEVGARHEVSRNGNYVREGIIYTPNSTPKLVSVSPILGSAKEAIQAHLEDKEFYPTNEQIERALADSIDFPQKNIEIPTNRLGDEKFTAQLFGGKEQARAYGEFLKTYGINLWHIYVVDKEYVDKQERPFARQLFFHLLDVIGSGLFGGYGDLLYDDRVRGVREVSREGARKVQ